ncbi:Acetolactate synthase isozyme 2 large subunit [Pigmentiphaga humi]|uniref:Acetolactate synthase isozyme 2 large subunit n=1 Tax=Pigmentiphaga humi TaxID=2478468 RepID=A0A3P4AYR4_9BURK|nr:thiamine pyrophosphate-binding protein [Pigmentiphaga humi]VCU68922.1 Acetolactate synthase isozyme 2 large subunit [Pigmentiphaga humi]
MIPTPSLRTGGQILVDALKIHGVDHAFCVPGESFLPALDALHAARDSIRTVVCRQEGAAAHMAEAYGKLTGKPGVCLVTRGPGATNASIGVHTASQDSTPMVLLVGQVGTGLLERQAWQEIDVRAMFGSLAKWATQVDHLERLPEMMNRAFQTAVSGRPGPVVVGLPEDVLYQHLDVADTRPFVPVQPQPGTEDMERLRGLIERSRRPLLVLGGGGWSADACDDMRAFAQAFQLPVGTAFRRQDLFDNTHPNYAGDIGVGVADTLAQRVRQADLVIAVGARLGETTTAGYTLLGVPDMEARFVHVHPAIDELGKVYRPDLAINAGMAAFAAAASRLAPPADPVWSDWTRSANADYLATLAPPAMPGTLNLGEVVRHLRERLPADAIVTNGAGNYTGWIHRFFQYPGFRTQLAPASGVMGYGTPAACAAALLHPDRTVVCFAGDGCFLMNSQELATARQYGLRVVFIVVNNGMYGSIRMHQEIHYPGRVFGTSLENPDFPALAAAYGIEGHLVERTADFAACFERALAAPHGALIELRIDPEAITPRTTLSALRRKSEQGR